MAAPTEAEIQGQLQDVTDLLEETRGFSEVNAKNVVALQDTIVQNQEGDFAQEVLAAVGAYRSRYSAVLASDANVLQFVIRHYGRFLASPTTATRALLDEIYLHFVATVQTVQTRGFVLATPVAGGGNVGDGVLHRLIVDQNSFTFENGFADAKTAEVTRDAFSGAELHAESIRLKGANASRDLLELGIGSGRTLDLQAVTTRNQGTLANAGFEQVVTGTGTQPSAGSPEALAANGLPNWTASVGAFTTVNAQTDNVYRTLPGVTLPIALELTANITFSQLLSTNRVQLSRGIPVFVALAVRPRVGVAAGTIALSLGTSSVAQLLTGIPAGSYTVIFIGLSAANWFENFNGANLAYQIALTALAGATVDIDVAILTQMTFFDGSYYTAMGGPIAWQQQDTFSWTDTDAGTGKIQRHLSRAFGRYLPHSGAPTLPDPA